MSTVIRKELSKELLQFLQSRGYSHILSLGVTGVELGHDGGSAEYLLIPVKENDPRLHYEETDHIISAIDSDDAKEMAAGVEFIIFRIDIPVSDFEAYLKQR